MKYINSNFLKAIIVLVGTSLYAQNDNGKNYIALKDSVLKDSGIVNTSDPRNYVTIFVESSKDRKVWKQNNLITSSYTFKREIDANSIVYIHFDKESLKKVRLDYNVSIGAKLNDRKIELSPFSEVGEKQKIINDVRPIDEVKTNITKLNNLQSYVISNDVNNYLLLEDDIRKEAIQNGTSKLNFDSNKENLKIYLDLLEHKNFTDTTVKNRSEILELKNKINDNARSMYPFLKDNGNTFKVFVEEINSYNDASQIKSINAKFREQLVGANFYIDVDNTSIARKRTLNQLRNNIEMLLNLYDYFNSKGKQTQMIFNSLTSHNVIFTNKMIESLKKFISLLDIIKIDSPITTDSVLNANSELLISNTLLIVELFKNFGNTIQPNIDLEEIIKELIFSTYFYGTIDLKKSTALEGDQLNIYLILTDPQDPNMKPIELPVAVFEVTALGWKFFKVSDSFNLIHSNYNTDDSTDSFVSSNYKPVPGVSLLASFAGNEKSDFWNVLYPSIGINLSYLDFYSNKDVEIGVGLIAGLFNNKLFFNIGYNLQASKKKSLYWGIGFSFVNLLNTLVKPNNSVGTAN
ncbi:MAG TPA: hypothetical protein PKE39_15310 [Ignavibacteria bacterium]|nr:hypothetical protein [Ignavibacteria bacterium]